MNYKTLLQSKTVWFNAITLTLAIIALPEFISILPTALLPYIAVVNSVGNLILRTLFTTKPIEVFPVQEEIQN